MQLQINDLQLKIHFIDEQINVTFLFYVLSFSTAIKLLLCHRNSGSSELTCTF